jgi:hypothetical protein
MKNLNARYAGVMDYAIKHPHGPNSEAALAREGAEYSWEVSGFDKEYDAGWLIAGTCSSMAKEDRLKPSDLPIDELMEILTYGAGLAAKEKVAA